MTTRTNIFMNAVAAILFVVCVGLTLQSCGKTVHSDENGSVSVELVYADPEDKETVVIDDVKLWIFNDDGGLVGKYGYGKASELGLQRFHLDDGRYLFVTAVNLEDPFTYSEVTKATDVERLMFGLRLPAASPGHAFYGVTEVLVKDEESSVVSSEIRRVLSELSIVMTGAPAGMRLDATVRCIASGIFPARKGSDGGYGLPTKEEIVNIPLPVGTESEGTVSTPVMRLMPSFDGSLATLIHLTLTLADGSILESDIVAPVMQSSGKYILTLRYTEMRAYMYVTSYKISDWVEGWVFNGEILDPQE